MARNVRNPAQRLRQAVDALPTRTRVAMLQGIERNRIIVGAYTDPKSGGICPMLAAHRNGGRTSLASFAVAWDAFTEAKRPRRATRREIRALRSYLELSLLRDEQQSASIAELAAGIRGERAAPVATEFAPPTAKPGPPAMPQPAEPVIRRVHAPRWARLRVLRRPSRRRDLITAAQENLSRG